MDNNSNSSSNSWNDEAIDRIKRDYHRSISTESNSSDKVSDMSVMLNRLASYQTWPDDVVTSATELTRCGFFYTGFKDEVRCCECGVKLQNWKMNDEPYQRHKAASSSCKFLLNIKAKPMQLIKNMNGANNYTDINNFVNGTEKERPSLPSQTPSKPILLPHVQDSTRQINTISGTTENNSPPVTPSPVPIKSNNDIINTMSRSREDTTQTNDWITPRPTQNQSLNNSEVDYTIESNRLASFVGYWPIDAPLTPAELVNAGFYFTGPGDRVQCAWCRGGLYNFEAGDTAIGEHIRHFPECHFIKNKMSQMVGLPNLAEVNQHQRNTTTTSTHIRNTTTPPTHIEPTDISQLTAVIISQEMGYSLAAIKKAMAKISSPPKDVTSEQLIDALFDLEDIIEDNEPSTEGATGGIESENINKMPSLFGNTEVSQNQELGELAEENERLKGKTMCKICLDKAVDTLFLPCRHLVCCEECAEAVQQCPVCRTVIVGTVKTFLS